MLFFERWLRCDNFSGERPARVAGLGVRFAHPHAHVLTIFQDAVARPPGDVANGVDEIIGLRCALQFYCPGPLCFAGLQVFTDRFRAIDRQLIGTKDFRTYLTTINAGGDPVQAFQDWVGQDVVAFEKDLADYLARLLPDGTLAPRRP